MGGQSVIKNYRGLLKRTKILFHQEPRVFLIANDNWMQLSLRYPVDIKRRRSVHDGLFMYILDAIVETEGNLMPASATIELAAAPAQMCACSREISQVSKGQRMTATTLSISEGRPFGIRFL